ncbi:MAG: hypothetical protein OHK0039_34910 [Bacteroidia bacterium]
MTILFIGSSNEFLGAYAQDIAGVHTVILSRDTPARTAARLACMAAEIALVILDVDHTHGSVAAAHAALRAHLPHSAHWALFSGQQAALRRQLMQVGFERILSPGDDLPALVAALHRTRFTDFEK